MAVIVTEIDMPKECGECICHKNLKNDDYGRRCECDLDDKYRTIDLLRHSRPNFCKIRSIDGLIKELEEKASWYMYDDWGNTTAVHDEVVRIIKKYCGGEQE